MSRAAARRGEDNAADGPFSATCRQIGLGDVAAAEALAAGADLLEFDLEAGDPVAVEHATDQSRRLGCVRLVAIAAGDAGLDADPEFRL